MKKFYVNIIQTYETGIEVFAENEDEARNIAENKCMDGEVKIDHGRDMTSYEMFVEEEKEN